MLLAFDIGNTNIVVGCFEGEELRAELRLSTDSSRTPDEYEALIDTLLRRRNAAGAAIDQVVISSVVPPVTPIIARYAVAAFGIEPLIVGPGVKTGISLRVPDPSAVGADRVVNAVAAKALFGAPALVIDFGTATSFDVVNRNGDYEGGIIAPGPRVALESLVRGTAKLPRIELVWPKQVVGNTTVTAMQSGTVVGYLCLIDGLVDRVTEEMGEFRTVIATGGLGRIFAEHSKRIQIYEPHLTLKGLRIIASMNRG